MVVLTAYCQVKPDCIEEALEACRTVRAASVLESGCDRYDFFQSPDDPTQIVFVEEWSSRADLDLHFEQEAFDKFMATMGDLMTGPPEIRIFDSTLME